MIPTFSRLAALLAGALGLAATLTAQDSGALIDALIRKGVRWRHLDRPSFVFRLAAYPQLVPAQP